MLRRVISASVSAIIASHTTAPLMATQGSCLPLRLHLTSSLCRITSYNVCYTKLLRITLTPTGAFNGFGAKVALDGDTIAVSSYVGRRENFTSAPVTVFVKPQSGWQDKTEDANLTDTNSATDDGFGMGLDVFGDVIASGAPYDDVDGDT